MRHVTLLCAVLGGWLLAAGCGHHTTFNGFGGSASTTESTTTPTAGGPCLVNADCPQSGQYYCYLPEDPCPKCYWQTPSCSTTADCTTGNVCDSCKTCVVSCASTQSCPANQTCSPTTMLCVPACQATSDCPTNFECVQGACGRKACSSDADCQGFCAGGVCVAKRGTCVECT